MELSATSSSRELHSERTSRVSPLLLIECDQKEREQQDTTRKVAVGLRKEKKRIPGDERNPDKKLRLMYSTSCARIKVGCGALD